MMQNPQAQYVTQPQQLAVNAQPQTVILQSATQYPTLSANYRSSQSKVLGTLQICGGLICIIVGIIELTLELHFLKTYHGIWGGAFFVLTGAFGIQAAKTKTNCKIVTFMVLSILSGVAALILLIIGAKQWAGIDQRCSLFHYSYSFCSDLYKEPKAINALFVFLGLGEGILAIWSSAICCASIGCGTRGVQGQTIQRNATTPQTGVQQVVTPAGGYSMQPQQHALQPQQHDNPGFAMPPPYANYAQYAPPDHS